MAKLARDNSELRFADIASVNPRTPLNGLDPNTPVSFVPMADVDDTGRWVNRQTRPLREVKTGYSPFAEGDTLFAKITPCTENGKGCHAQGLPNGIGFGSTEFHVLRAKQGTLPRLVFHLAQSPDVRWKAAALMDGSAGQQRVPADFFKLCRIAPDILDDQEVKCDLFDAVDAAIDATRRVIEQTRRLKKAVLQDLLTRGLPGRHSAYRDVYRLGNIPKAWAVTPLRRLAEIQQGIALGPHREPKHSPVPYLRVANVQAGWIDLSEIKDIEATAAERERYALQVDDVLIVEGHANINDLGRAALVDERSERLVFQNHLFRLRVDRKRLDPRFLVYWVNSHAGRDYFRIFGGTTSGLNTVGAGQIGSLKFPTPPIEEQEAIADLVQAIDRRLDSAQRDCLQLGRAKTALSQALLTGRVRVAQQLETTS